MELPSGKKALVLGGFMTPVKVKVIGSRPKRVDVTVRRPQWQEFLSY